MADARTTDYDALLFLSFGGPEGHEDVRPFLENVTRGRGIPPERLDEVEVHYHHFGGVSPLNQLNREIIANVRAELSDRGIELPVYFGNRNWHPMAADTAAEMAGDGIRNALVFATSAWAGYSGCRQYDEDIAGMRERLAAEGLPEIRFTKLRQFYDHPLFIGAMADAVRAAYQRLPDHVRDSARLMFTAHSIPTAADNAAGVDDDGPLYSRQVQEAAALVAREVGVTDFDVVWQSRSGSPHTPWLEPDIVDHVTELHHDRGLPAAVVCPIGFVSDHIEVVWDLDSELADEAEQFGIPIERTATAGPTPEFAKMVVDLAMEMVEDTAPVRLGSAPLKGCTVNGAYCGTGCCAPARRPAGARRAR
ncbi:ferrochelatase [Corynebacterium sp. P7003]|uniref:Coproporphyrin III ferrochelatase n=1 Tax=Corynebacterium pygosceleis TaxID=2800406 RepID=A0ABT3WQZ4_9CORY|nr:ferrochelatase [Corynebacterium pygosceleis]MCX7443754.1 ferrochelatase [Corynebacterium pygosceleis]